MSEICKSLINDFLSGSLSRQELGEGLTSLFQLSDSSSTQAQYYLHQLYTDQKINDQQFQLLSETVSTISIQTTLSSAKATTDISYFNEDKTLNLTDLSEAHDDTTGAADQTVIIRTDTAKPATNTDYNNDNSVDINTEDTTPHTDISLSQLPPQAEAAPAPPPGPKRNNKIWDQELP